MNLDGGIYDCDQLYGPVFTLNCKKIAYIVIRNGYGKNAQSFRNNSRAKDVYFANLDAWRDEYTDWDDEAILYSGKLQDTMEPQRLEISEDKSCNNNVRKVQMIFGASSDCFYRGAKWNDLCISEVEFWGYE